VSRTALPDSIAYFPAKASHYGLSHGDFQMKMKREQQML
jgi:hypothetical protein